MAACSFIKQERSPRLALGDVEALRGATPFQLEEIKRRAFQRLAWIMCIGACLVLPTVAQAAIQFNDSNMLKSGGILMWGVMS